MCQTSHKRGAAWDPSPPERCNGPVKSDVKREGDPFIRPPTHSPVLKSIWAEMGSGLLAGSPSPPPPACLAWPLARQGCRGTGHKAGIGRLMIGGAPCCVAPPGAKAVQSQAEGGGPFGYWERRASGRDAHPYISPAREDQRSNSFAAHLASQVGIHARWKGMDGACS